MSHSHANGKLEESERAISRKNNMKCNDGALQQKGATIAGNDYRME
jgi:hypothetical protein